MRHKDFKTLQLEGMTSVQIVPQEVVTVQYIHSVQINVVGVTLNTDATLNITLYGPSNMSVVKSEQIKMTGEDYKKWSSNDDYVVEYVLNYYGFTRAT